MLQVLKRSKEGIDNSFNSKIHKKKELTQVQLSH